LGIDKLLATDRDVPILLAGFLEENTMVKAKSKMLEKWVTYACSWKSTKRPNRAVPIL